MQRSISDEEGRKFLRMEGGEREQFVDEIAARNVLRTVQEITERSRVIRDAVRDGRVMVVGLLYNLRTGEVRLLSDHARIEGMKAEAR